MSEIATRWHLLGDAVRDRRVRAFADTAGGSLSFVTDQQIDFDALQSYVSEMSATPRFVVANNAIELTRSDQALLSISDMISCNLLRLPFKNCVVEFLHNSVVYNVLLKEFDIADGSREWEGRVLAYRGRALNDDAVLAFPCTSWLKIQPTDGPLYDTEASPPAYPSFEYCAARDPVFKHTADEDNLVEDAHYFVFERCVTAMCAALLLPQTIGISQVLSETKPAFNKSRLSKGRSPIPNYTFIRLNGNIGEDGRSGGGGNGGVAVHLRRAHKRRIAIGEGRKGRVWRFFPPQVVGYLPDGRKPSMPEMLATRGTKPYLIK